MPEPDSSPGRCTTSKGESPSVLRGRKKIGVAIAGIATMAVVSVLPSSPAMAEPSIKDVKTKVDDLYHQAEVVQERVNDQRLRLSSLNQDLSGLKADEERQAVRLEAVRAQVRDSIVDDYQGGSLASVGELIVSDDPNQFLERLSTVASYNDLTDGIYATYETEKTALDVRRKATAKRRAEIRSTSAELGAEQAKIETKLKEAKGILAGLEKKQREKLLSQQASSGVDPAEVSTNAKGNAAAAIKFAMSQVGDAYVFGAAGPNAWDCSGLMMVAWAQAGVSLPHSSRMQSGMGTPVSISALQPGDLVFYYSPVSHVGMYIGNGLLVHAANPGAGVKVSPVNEMPITGARRVG